GVGGRIMRGIMKDKNLMLMEELMTEAAELGVRFTACTMSMSVMGITRRDLADLPNLDFAGVTSFVGDARAAGVSLVF
ncbi:MAG: DsrE/DsrF/DrsH-like family protein, partial [Myxococcota bacterium]